MINGKPYKVHRYEQILEKHLLITLLSEHSISFNDLENMPLLDRDFIFDKLMERQKHIEEIRARNSQRPKS